MLGNSSVRMGAGVSNIAQLLSQYSRCLSFYSYCLGLLSYFGLLRLINNINSPLHEFILFSVKCFIWTALYKGIVLKGIRTLTRPVNVGRFSAVGPPSQGVVGPDLVEGNTETVELKENKL